MPAPNAAGARPAGRPEKPLTPLQLIGAALGIIVCIILWNVGPFWGMEAGGQHYFAILIMCVIFWFTQPIPSEFTALLLITLPFLLNIVDMKTAFGGFTSNTTWFIFGALLCGKIVSVTGLDKRVAYNVLAKLGRFGSSYKGVLLSVFIVAFIATFVIPSGTVMITLLCVIFFPFISAFGVESKSNIGKGLLMYAVFVVVTNGKMFLTGSNFNMVVWGTLADNVNQNISWLNWFISMAPACIIVCFIMYFVIRAAYKPEVPELAGGAAVMKEKVKELGKMKPEEKRAAILFALALVLWMTGELTNIPVASVAIGVALLSMLPKIGVQSFRDGISRLNWPILIFTAAVMGMPSVMGQLGVDAAFNSAFNSIMGGSISSPLIFLGVVWLLTQIGCWLGLSMATAPIMLPMLFPFCETFGIPYAAVVFVCTLSAPMVFFYHGPHPLIASGYGTFEQTDFIKMGFVYMLAWIPVLLLMWYVWWPLCASWGLIF